MKIDWKQVWKEFENWWIRQRVRCPTCDLPLDEKRLRAKIERLVEKQLKKKEK